MKAAKELIALAEAKSMRAARLRRQLEMIRRLAKDPDLSSEDIGRRCGMSANHARRIMREEGLR